MLGPCIPIAKVVTAVVTRPARHAIHHVVARVARHSRPRVGMVATPRPSPAPQCLQKPGALPAGPGPAAPALRNAGTSPSVGRAARLGAGTAGSALAAGSSGAASAGGGAGTLAAMVAAAGLAMGGAMMASTTPSTPTPDTSALVRADDVQDTMRIFRLAEAIPGIASSGLPTGLTLPDRLRSPSDAGTPAARPGGPSAGPTTPVPAAALPV